MNPRQQLLDALTAERFTPTPNTPRRAVNHGPSVEYEALQRRRLLWELAADDCPQAWDDSGDLDADPSAMPATPQTAAVRVNAAFTPFTAKGLMTPPLPAGRDTCADGGGTTTDDSRRTA